MGSPKEGPPVGASPWVLMNLRRTHEYTNLIVCKTTFLMGTCKTLGVFLLGEIPQSRERNKMPFIYAYIYNLCNDILCTRAHKS